MSDYSHGIEQERQFLDGLGLWAAKNQGKDYDEDEFRLFRLNLYRRYIAGNSTSDRGVSVWGVRYAEQWVAKLMKGRL